MSAAAASATERDDLQIIQALQGVEKGRWWNIASYAPGTCSLARLIGCPQERFNAFVRGHKLGGYNKGSTTRTLTVEEIYMYRLTIYAVRMICERSLSPVDMSP